MDNFGEILNHLSFNAEVFFSGNMCGIQALGGKDTGHLHLLQSGVLTIVTNEGHKIVLDKPSVIFIPGPSMHRIIADESHSAQLVCATVKFNSANQESVVNSLPQFIYFPIKLKDKIGSTAEWLFEEAFSDKVGRQALLDKLSDVFLLQVLRHVMDKGVLLQGILSAHVHPQLSKVIDAIHANPSQNWTLDSLADVAAMSRSKFAEIFKTTVGQTPLDYLTDLRLAMAQNLLKYDKPVSLVANEVGYEHGSALARIFRKKLGLSPREWLQSIRKN